MSIAGIDGLPFYAITPWVMLYAVFSLVVHRLQYPSAYDLFFEGLLLAECIAGTKGNSEAEDCHSRYSECGMPVHCVHCFWSVLPPLFREVHPFPVIILASQRLAVSRTRQPGRSPPFGKQLKDEDFFYWSLNRFSDCVAQISEKGSEAQCGNELTTRACRLLPCAFYNNLNLISHYFDRAEEIALNEEILKL